MRRVLVLVVLLTVVFTVSACGGSESQRSEEAPSEQGGTAPAARGAAPPVRSPAEEGSRGDEGAEEADGLGVTTIEGEEVAVGGQGDVTALYFMAGW